MRKKMVLEKGDGAIRKLPQKTRPDGLTKFWYICYYNNGRQVRENSKAEDWQEAYDLLIRRRAEVEHGRQPAAEMARVRYEDLRDALVEDYKLRRVVSLYKRGDGYMFRGMDHFNRFFRARAATAITPDMIRQYIKWRRAEGDADPTIRRQLIHLRAAFRLAAKEGKLQSVPFFPMPQDSEPAGQYVDPAMFVRLLNALPQPLHPLFIFLYYTGCRIGAAKLITWEMVSKDSTEINVSPEATKNRSPLLIVLAGTGLASVSEMLAKLPRSPGGRVFYITNYRASWTKACKTVGTSARIHDLRCSAAINLVDAGVAEDIVMKIGGWRTKSMFSRYNVMNSERIRAAMVKGAKYVAGRMKG